MNLIRISIIASIAAAAAAIHAASTRPAYSQSKPDLVVLIAQLFQLLFENLLFLFLLLELCQPILAEDDVIPQRDRKHGKASFHG